MKSTLVAAVLAVAAMSAPTPSYSFPSVPALDHHQHNNQLENMINTILADMTVEEKARQISIQDGTA